MLTGPSEERRRRVSITNARLEESSYTGHVAAAFSANVAFVSAKKLRSACPTGYKEDVVRGAVLSGSQFHIIPDVENLPNN